MTDHGERDQGIDSVAADQERPAGTVTALVESSRRPGRFELAIDGRDVGLLSIDAVQRLGVRVGAAVSGALRAAIEADAQDLRTYDRALGMLASRARSARELRRQLVRKGEPEGAADRAIARLLELGLLDDASYARQFARSKMSGAGLSTRRVQAELARRGVARDTADQAIADVVDDEDVDQDATLDRVARKKLRTLAALDPATRRRRLYAFLARRGYDSDDIRRALERLDANDPPDPEPD